MSTRLLSAFHTRIVIGSILLAAVPLVIRVPGTEQSEVSSATVSPAPSIDKTLAPLTPRSRIVLPGVFGRIDHFGYDSRRGNLFVAALGNDTVEVINSLRRVHTIKGLDHPQATSATVRERLPCWTR